MVLYSSNEVPRIQALIPTERASEGGVDKATELKSKLKNKSRRNKKEE